jgi:hypothetical protein
MGFPSFAEQLKIVPAFQDQTGAAIAGDWVNLEGYGGCLILLHEMRGANGTATVIRVDKARTVAGGDQSTGITMNNFWYVQDMPSVTGDVGGTAAASVGATDTWTKGTAATSFTGSTTQSVGQWVVIDVNADDLPDSTYEDYNCIQLQVVSSNGAHYLSAWYILYNPRYARQMDDQPSALVN